MTSVDSNVIFSVVEPRDSNHSSALALLEAGRQMDALVIAPVVYAELMASDMRGFIQAFLERSAIPVLWLLPPEVWERAGIAFGEYTRARRGRRLPVAWSRTSSSPHTPSTTASRS
jgi:predicted nucleic acid-binding protein